MTERVTSFSLVPNKSSFLRELHASNGKDLDVGSPNRRSFLVDTSSSAAAAALAVASSILWIPPATAAIGVLPELQTTNVVLQSITVTVADQSQLESMITFLKNSFDFKVLRQTTEGTVTNTVRLRY
jgi:hypothetical protein